MPFIALLGGALASIDGALPPHAGFRFSSAWTVAVDALCSYLPSAWRRISERWQIHSGLSGRLYVCPSWPGRLPRSLAEASSDGSSVLFASRFVLVAPPRVLASVIAHELAHVALSPERPPCVLWPRIVRGVSDLGADVQASFVDGARRLLLGADERAARIVQHRIGLPARLVEDWCDTEPDLVRWAVGIPT
jgi:hypothetical protein